MPNDPRNNLAPGVYRATVTKSVEGWVDYDSRGIVSVEYSLPGCGDWRWAIRSDKANQEFLAGAVERGWFEFEVKP